MKWQRQQNFIQGVESETITAKVWVLALQLSRVSN